MPTDRSLLPTHEREAVAREIEALVQRLGSQEEAATALRVSQQAVSRATNHRRVGPALARAVTDYLHVTLAQLVERHGLRPERSMSDLEIAIAYLEDVVAPEAVRRVRAHAGERKLRPMQWGELLIAEQQALTGSTGERAPASVLPASTTLRKRNGT